MVGDKAIVFDISGEMAHFRAYYTNTSSLSYGFPPRTVVEGIIGAILGLERDSYYDILSPEHCNISVSIKKPFRKIIQSVNYVRTKPDEDNFNKFSNTVDSYLKRNINTYPVSLEILLPLNDSLKYRVYLHAKKEDLNDSIKIHDSIKNKLNKGKTFYSVYLGITEFLADIKFIDEFEIKTPNKDKGVISVVPEEHFEDIQLAESISLIVEKMPVHFVKEGGVRKIEGVKKYVYEKNCKEIPLKDYREVYSINNENIVWME